VGRRGVDASGSGCGPVTGSCEHGNELSGPIRGGGEEGFFILSISRRPLLCGVGWFVG
jgi:hypothetical protein